MKLIDRIKDFQGKRFERRGVKKGWITYHTFPITFVSVHPPVLIISIGRESKLKSFFKKLKWFLWNEIFLCGWWE